MTMAIPTDSVSFIRNCLLLRPNCTAIVEDEFTQSYSHEQLCSYGIRDLRTFRGVLLGSPQLFVLNEVEGKEFVSLTSRLTLCPAHSKKSGSCKDNACEGLHLCTTHLLSGKCSFGTGCIFGHSVEIPQNERVLKTHRLENLNVDELRMIFRLPFVRRGVTRPHVCHYYNSDVGCTKVNAGQKCRSIHLCNFYVKNKCKNGERCRLNHDINDQVKEVLDQYGVSTERKPREILHELLIYTESEKNYDMQAIHKKWLTSDLSGGKLGPRPTPAQTSQRAKPVCKYFQQGRCKYGNDCTNDHSMPAEPKPAQGRQLFTL